MPRVRPSIRVPAAAVNPTAPACPACNGQDLERVISMFAVSSDGTRKLALDAGRKRAAGMKREKDHADAEYERNHPHD